MVSTFVKKTGTVISTGSEVKISVISSARIPAQRPANDNTKLTGHLLHKLFGRAR